MLIPVRELVNRLGIMPNGVLHVGAHLAEEAPEYENLRWVPVIWVESQQELVKEVRNKLDPSLHTVIEATVWDISDQKLVFKKTNSSQSSSLLNLGTHLSDYPDITVEEEYEVVTSRLDSIIFFEDMPNFLNLDIQGAEGQALKSLGANISKIKFIYTEVNRRDVYLDCTKASDIDSFLQGFGFYRAITRWKIGRGWGDALYLRYSDYNPKIVTLKFFTLQSKYYSEELFSYLKRYLWKYFFKK
jgi:FkbM family methyltransferase